MYSELINQIKQVVSLTGNDVALVKNLFHFTEIKRNDYFLQEGQICKQVAFVKKGIFRYFINDNGEEKTFSFSSENQFMSNYESFIPQTASFQCIQALENSEILTISHADLEQFYLKVDKAERFGRIAIEQIFIQLLQDLKSFYTDNEQQRYEKFIALYPDIQQRIPQYHIASYVGVKPQSLSRIRKRI